MATDIKLNFCIEKKKHFLEIKVIMDKSCSDRLI